MLECAKIDTVALLQSAIQQGLLATIEDFLWFTIALVQPPQDVSGFDAGVASDTVSGHDVPMHTVYEATVASSLHNFLPAQAI